MSLSHKGKLSPFKGRHHSEETKKKLKVKCHSRGMKGKTHSKKARKKMSIAKKGKPSWSKGKFGDKSPNWRGGISYLPYPPTFNRELKQFIEDRDNNECQNPFCRGNSKRLRIHHIDFNKDNCSQFNLITLCDSCNLKANRVHRWQRLYRKIIWSKYE